MRIAHVEGVTYAVSAFFPGEITSRKPKQKPTRRSYAELPDPAALGKFKRWETIKGVEHYHMLFSFKGAIRQRYEKGMGGKGEVKEVGKGEGVAPLDGQHPHLAWLLAKRVQEGEVLCACAVPPGFGKARVRRGGVETISLHDGREVRAKVVVVDGACGRFTLFLDEAFEPIVMETSEARYERLP